MAANPEPSANITDARAATSVDAGQRMKRYAITMAFRTVCFLAAVIFAHGWLQWVLFGGAVFLPYVAVLLANQADQKGSSRTVPAGTPSDAPQLTVGPQHEYVEGEVIADVQGGVHDTDERWNRHHRVA